MKFSINADYLKRVVKSLVVVARNNAMDSTGRVVVEATDSEVIFSANNGATAISFTTSEVVVDEVGKVAITYNDIKSFVSSFKSWDETSGVKEFKFFVDDRNTIILVDNFLPDGKISKGKLKLNNYNTALITKPQDFNSPNFVLNSTIFRKATDKVLYAVMQQADFDHPALQGVLVRFEEENIYFTGCNNKVLSEYQVKNVSDLKEGSFILQYDFVMGLRRLLNDDIPLMWEIKGSKVKVKFDDVLYVGGTIVGHEFPAYTDSLNNYTEHINFNKELLVSMLQPFIDVLDPEDNFRVTLKIKDKMLNMSNVRASIDSELDVIGGLDFSVDLNGKFLLQTIDSIKDDYVLFKFNDNGGPIIFDSSTFNDQKAIVSQIKKR